MSDKHVHDYQLTNRQWCMSDEQVKLFRSFDVHKCDCGDEIKLETTTFPKYKSHPIYNPNPVDKPGGIKIHGLPPIDWNNPKRDKKE